MILLSFYVFVVAALLYGFAGAVNQRTFRPNVPVWVAVGQCAAAAYLLFLVVREVVR